MGTDIPIQNPVFSITVDFDSFLGNICKIEFSPEFYKMPYNEQKLFLDLRDFVVPMDMKLTEN